MNAIDTPVSESQFYMWRAIFAVAHADGVVTDEEVRFMAETLEIIPFSESQKAILSTDAKETRDVEDMFKGITDPADQAEFFKIAHKLVHVDGDYGEAEQSVMLKLKALHVREVDVDSLIGRVDLQLEDDKKPSAHSTNDKDDSEDVLYSFRNTFLQKLRRAS